MTASGIILQPRWLLEIRARLVRRYGSLHCRRNAHHLRAAAAGAVPPNGNSIPTSSFLEKPSAAAFPTLRTAVAEESAAHGRRIRRNPGCGRYRRNFGQEALDRRDARSLRARSHALRIRAHDPLARAFNDGVAGHVFKPPACPGTSSASAHAPNTRTPRKPRNGSKNRRCLQFRAGRTYLHLHLPRPRRPAHPVP